jgi:murein DD-endopeptidase MepM/ murein hydrolase activator NlpD
MRRSLSLIGALGLTGVAGSGLPLLAETSRVELAAPTIITSKQAPPTELQLAPGHTSPLPILAPSGKNSYIDTTTYSTPVAPQKVVISDRQPRQPRVTPRIARRQAPAPTPRLVARQPRPTYIPPTPIAQQPPVSLRLNGLNLALAPIRRLSTNLSKSQEDLGISQKYLRATRMAIAPETQPLQRTDLLYPLSLPAAITSAFGWRIHPITNQARMHYGTDLGAPLGTPVLAAYAGEVAAADWVGGYGLMITLRHLEGKMESRYAHLQEIYVQPGDRVEQGAVIGAVGSTGLSTGPHLHFEWRHLTEEGWVAVDAGLHLEMALENLNQRLLLAQNSAQE